MIQLWKDVFIALDVETSGLNPQVHEITQLAAVAVTTTLQVNTNIPFFNMLIQPTNPAVAEAKALAKSHLTLDTLMAHGVDQSSALRYWHDWLAQVVAPSGGRVVPIGFNYVFDRDFLISFMGFESYSATFGAHVRDVMRAFTYMYDRFNYNEHNPGFTSLSLAKCCEALGVENTRAHDALHDSIATLECYKRMMSVKLPP